MLTFLFLFFAFVGSTFANENLYSVEFRDAEVKTVIRLLAKMAGKNVVVPDTIEGKVTASFDDVRLNEALNAILKTNGFGVIEEGNVIQVTSLDELTKLGSDLRTMIYDLKFAKAEKVLPNVQTMLSEKGSAVFDDMTNSIYVRDKPAALDNVSGLIASLDKKGKQVLIEAKIIEASTDFIRDVGIQWGVTKSGGSIQTSGLTAVGTDDKGRTLMLNTPVRAGGIPPAAGMGLILGSFRGVLTDIQLTAAEQNGNIKILARPTIATLNNQPANIRSGTKFYIKTYGNVNIGGATTTGTTTTSSGTSTTGTGTNLQEIDTGIELKVTPQISSDDFIRMDIEATQSEADFSQAVEGVPAIVDKTASTTVVLRNKETTIIGGLFHVREAQGVKGVPGLMKVPIVGNLFKSKMKRQTKRELLIFLTPSVIESAVDAVPFFAEQDSKLGPPKQEEIKEDKKPPSRENVLKRKHR